MRNLIGTIVCIIALAFAALPAVHGMDYGHGMDHGHDNATMPVAMDADRSNDLSDLDSSGMEDCGMIAGHCSTMALAQDISASTTFYPSTAELQGFNERLKAKHRPETELRPPRV